MPGSMRPRMKGGRWFRRDILAVVYVESVSSAACLCAKSPVLLYALVLLPA